MQKHPNHPQISLELTAKPHAWAASIEEFPRDEFTLLTYGLWQPQSNEVEGSQVEQTGQRGCLFHLLSTRNLDDRSRFIALASMPVQGPGDEQSATNSTF